MENKIYCAFDQLNCPVDRETGKEVHVCDGYNSAKCIKCPSRFDGDRIKEYMATHERIE